MEYDKKIRVIIRSIKHISDCYLIDTEHFNECAATDRLIERIIDRAKELEEWHNKRFDICKEREKKELLRQ